jgi:NAD dependent epimerase/dehydratase family enzyme
MSWIHIDDLCKMISKAIDDEKMSGIYNAVAPQPLQYRNMVKLLAQILEKKYFIIRIPGWILKLFLGEMACLATEGTRVSSRKIESTGFVFSYPQANYALRNLLDK